MRNGGEESLMSEVDPPIPRKVQQCIGCGSRRLTKYENNRIVCMDCGLVITVNTADHTPEWNSGSKRQEITYVNASTKTLTDADGVFSATANRRNSDEDFLNGNLQNRLLEKWWRAAGVSDATEKNLALAFSEITKIGSALSLPKSVLEKASTIYKMIVEKRYVRGRSIRALSAAAIYMACKQCGFFRTLDEVAMGSRMNRRDVGRGYRFLVKELGCSIPSVNPRRYLPRFLDRLVASEKTREIIDKILNAADELQLTSGRNPVGMVAACSYIASLLTGEKKTQREMAEVARVTEATIRNRYKELIKRVLLVIAL